MDDEQREMEKLRAHGWRQASAGVLVTVIVILIVLLVVAWVLTQS
jgi:hypothetical protein